MLDLRIVPAFWTWPALLFLWPTTAILFGGAALTDRMVEWDDEKPPSLAQSTTNADRLAAVPFVIGVGLSLPTHATLPAGSSLSWPIGALVVMALSLPLRAWAIVKLGGSFNGKLRVKRGQVVVTTGPYAVVRHPGYTATASFAAALLVAFGFWPAVIGAVVSLALLYRRRIAVEEAINRREIIGYEEYMRNVRWRMIPWVW
jgi:protein-S-isoprenylcysteine O-methyltransferase Ste14